MVSKKSVKTRKKKCIAAAKASGLVRDPTLACDAAFAGTGKSKMKIEKTKIDFP